MVAGENVKQRFMLSRARERHKIQIIHVIQSFSKNEFDPKNPEDIQKANLVGQEIVRKHYPGRQALVCTQTDVIGGCVHNHILINDVSMVDNKGCTNVPSSLEPWVLGGDFIQHL